MPQSHDVSQQDQKESRFPQKVAFVSGVAEFLESIEDKISQIDIFAKLALESIGNEGEVDIFEILSHAYDCAVSACDDLKRAKEADSKKDEGLSALFHDHNNFMLGLAGALGLALDSLEFGRKKDLISMLSKIEECANGFRDRKEKKQIGKIESLQSVVYYALMLSEAHKKKAGDVSVILNFPAEPIKVDGSSQDWIRVFMNLIKNAYDAFFETRLIDVSRKEENILEIDVKVVDDILCIQVIDNAHGINRELLRKIFQPYFSTKGTNGTGIGLHFCKEFIEKCDNGKLGVYSREGEGTVFTINASIAK
jgi:signal transduction histidine kinase